MELIRWSVIQFFASTECPDVPKEASMKRVTLMFSLILAAGLTAQGALAQTHDEIVLRRHPGPAGFLGAG